jgi:GNAT superfamily N-acetyltransferase
MDYRVATDTDTDAITETITLAFQDDPVWGAALRRPDGATGHLRPFWRLYVEGALRFSTAYLTDAAAATAVWTPPGETELSDDEGQRLFEIAGESLEPDKLAALLELFDRFDAAHPHDQPHAYLGLLATHPEYRGHGIAQQLLAENLADLDSRGIPAYLESTNPVNDHRYERAGFRAIGGFSAVLEDAHITTMWRDPQRG